MAQSLRYDTDLPPSKLIERLEAATVSYQDVANWRSPLASYGTFLKESFTGPKRVIAKIDGQRFCLMPISTWPFKGTLPLASVGAMHGVVEGSDVGSCVQARFKVNIFSYIALIFFGLISVLMMTLGLLLYNYGGQFEGREFVLAMCGFFSSFGPVIIMYLFVATRTQERATRRFLDQLCSQDIE